MILKIGKTTNTTNSEKTFLRINTYNDEGFLFLKKLLITIIECYLCGKLKKVGVLIFIFLAGKENYYIIVKNKAK